MLRLVSLPKTVKYILRTRSISTSSQFVTREELDERDIAIKNELKKISSSLDKFIGEQQKFNRRLDGMLRQIKSGLGRNFEEFNRKWLLQLARAKGINVSLEQIIKSFPLPTPRKHIVQGASSVEIDLFCANPLMMAECTTFLGPNEMKKVHRFVKAASHVKELYSSPPLAFFLTYGVDPSIGSELHQLLLEGGVNLILSEE